MASDDTDGLERTSDLRRLLFVHLSDLHFSSRPRESKWELDQTLRNELRHDLRAEIRNRGGATGILVSGDVAFSGATTEYAKARDFFTQLCIEIGLPTEDLWVIPGNHDVQWARHQDPHTARARAAVMEAPEHKIDAALETVMGEPADARAFMSPLANYFDFAADFGCQPSVSDLAWDAVFEMGHGYALQIRGVNSALVSDAADESKLPQLVVGAAQTQLQRAPGTVHLTVCHHPARWIRDRAQLVAMFDSNAQLQLTGHEHRFAISREQPLKIAAGALHPERDQIDWDPRYNLITIELIEPAAAEAATVRICVTPRIWDKANSRWGPDPAARDDGSVCFDVTLDDVATLDSPALNDADERYEEVAPDQDIERLVNRRRRLEYRLARLFEVEQRALANAHGMTLREIADTDSADLPATVVARADTQGSLPDLWEAVERAHGITDLASNPFREA